MGQDLDATTEHLASATQACDELKSAADAKQQELAALNRQVAVLQADKDAMSSQLSDAGAQAVKLKRTLSLQDPEGASEEVRDMGWVWVQGLEVAP